MSLTPSIFPAEFESFMLRYISLDNSFLPLYNGDQIESSVGDYPSSFASSYETYSLSGEVLGALHGAQSPDILESYLRTFSTSVTDFATALANYWSTVLIVPGAPAHGGKSVATVTNDASSQISAFESAIIATFTIQLETPVFVNLINNIEAIALPSVTWFVTEVMPNDTLQTFTENVT